MQIVPIFLILTGLCLEQASATLWYFLRWTTPSSGYEFTKFSVDMVAPTLKEAGTFYLWPGLQDTGNTGVYQEVLDGRSGTWWIGAGWCCSNPSLSWGSGFNVAGGTISIDMTRDTGTANWISTISSGSSKVTDSFPLSYKNFNQALLAIELDGVTWDFGQLFWNNVIMVMNTTETSWCTNKPENYDSTTKYTMTTPQATVSGTSTTCTISQVVFEGPA